MGVVSCMQAQQDVESFLEQAAEEAVGSSYGPAGGKFASKDVRVSLLDSCCGCGLRRWEMANMEDRRQCTLPGQCFMLVMEF